MNTTQPPVTMETADTLISGGTLITMDPKRRIIQDGAIAVRGDKIVYVGKMAEAEKRFDAKETIDAGRFVVTPGFINSHIHITGDPLTRGYVPDEIPVGFEEKLSRWVIPRYQAHTESQERLSAQLAAVEMLRSGTTCFLEAGTIRYLDAVVDGLVETGIRARVGTWVQGRSTAHGEDQAALNAEAIKVLELEVARYPSAEDTRISAWPILIGHTTNTEEVWLAAKSIADSSGSGISAHMSPYRSDPEWYLEHTGKRPIEFLAGLGVLGGNVCLTHVVHIDEHEMELMAATNTNAIHCPLAALKDASGITTAGRFPEMARAGINILLGTDGYAADIMTSMKLVSAIFKDAREDCMVFPAAESLNMVTMNAALALGLQSHIGSLEPGKKADLVLHDTNRPEWCPKLNILNQLIWSADGRGVHSVWVDGVRLIDNYRCTSIDEEALYTQAQHAAEEIVSRSGIPLLCPWPVV